MTQEREKNMDDLITEGDGQYKAYKKLVWEEDDEPETIVVEEGE